MFFGAALILAFWAMSGLHVAWWVVIIWILGILQVIDWVR